MADPLIEASLVRHVLDGYFHRGNHRGGGTTPFFTTLLHFLNGAVTTFRAPFAIFAGVSSPRGHAASQGWRLRFRGPLSPAPPITRPREPHDSSQGTKNVHRGQSRVSLRLRRAFPSPGKPGETPRALW